MMEQQSLHPVIRYLSSRVTSLLSVVQLEENGHVVEPDGFRLKNLPSWAFEAYPTLFDSLGSPSGQCNLHCAFCYEKGNPLPFGHDKLTLAETRTRIRHFNPDTRQGLPLFSARLYKEPFTNPQLPEILERVRQADPHLEIPLTTNGSLFTETLLETLRALVPVNLCVSLNSSRPDGRRRLTGDWNSGTSIRMISRLEAHQLPYSGSIVAWPDLPDEEIVETIRFLDAHHARMIRVSLPGYSRFFSKTPPFDTRQTWRRMLDLLLPLRDEIATPLLVLPSLYHEEALVPNLAGVIQGSPASRAGLRQGDRILSVEGVAATGRIMAKQLLEAHHADHSLALSCERNGQTREVLLTEIGAGPEQYPYRPAGYAASKAHPFGLVLIDDFDPAWIWDVLRRIEARQARQVLLMTSVLMEPVVAALFDAIPNLDERLGDTEVSLWVPTHAYWGGNIIMGDLYTCSDYRLAMDEFMAQKGVRPDLVLIPGSFSPNGFNDLLGVPWSSLSLGTGINVELLDCAPLTL